jgi:hypothetical protein
MDEIEPDKINIDSLKTFSDKNTIESTKKKLDQIIEKYNLGTILKIFEKEFIPLEISNVTQSKINSKISANSHNKNYTVKSKYNSKMKSVKGGSVGTTAKGGAALAKRLIHNINSHGVIVGSTMTFVEFIFIMMFARVFLFLLDEYHDGTLRDSIRDILNNSFQKLIAFYYRLRFLILNETIVIENYREIITLPYSEITDFSGHAQNAVLIPENREGQLKQLLDSLLAQYNRSQDYRIYSNLSNAEKNELLRTINQIENELADLLQPTELIPIENVSNENVSNDNFDARNDIVADPILVTDETKNIFKFFLRFCLIRYNNNNTTTGGRTKTRTHKRKTNNKNKKRKNRTNRNKRISRSS